MSEQKCSECDEQASCWCSTCKARICDWCIELCSHFGHDWGYLDEGGKAV